MIIRRVAMDISCNDNVTEEELIKRWDAFWKAIKAHDIQKKNPEERISREIFKTDCCLVAESVTTID